jgi:protoporphyrinogen oxidase
MTLIIVLNAILCLGVIATVVSPLLWAIFTQHRDHVAAAGAFGPRVAAAPRQAHNLRAAQRADAYSA